eukprot:6665526-Prymnesium_polylepis.3
MEVARDRKRSIEIDRGRPTFADLRSTSPASGKRTQSSESESFASTLVASSFDSAHQALTPRVRGNWDLRCKRLWTQTTRE